MKPVVVYLTMKGGVGKTTLAANLTRAIADIEKRKILLIDADSQCNLTQLFTSQEELDGISQRTIYGALAGDRDYDPGDLKFTIYTNPANGSSIDLIRGSFETFSLAVEASPLIERRTAERFRLFIDKAQREYDLIAIDTNPSATLMTMQALAVANFLIAPISFDKFSLRGVNLITSLLKAKHQWLGNPYRVRVVANRIKKPGDNDAVARDKLIKSEEQVREAFPELSRCIVPGYIRDSAIISNEARRVGFVADQKDKLQRAHLDNLLGDFNRVAQDVVATFKQGYTNEPKQPQTVIDLMRRKFPRIFTDPVDGSQSAQSG